MKIKQEVITFKGLYQAYCDCRKRKRGTANAQRYEMRLLDNLFQTKAALQSRNYSPSRSIRFVAQKPKAREIHAADFQDRVVHHWLVLRLERLFEPVFIHDVYSNRKGKGTHRAVARVQSFIHAISQHHTSARPVYYLQLDIANFFNTLDCPVLFKLIQHRLRKSVKQQKITLDEADTLRWLCHRLLKHDTTLTAQYRGNPRLLKTVPKHKMLAHGGANKGLPIGNLTSQFFANVYMNPLDQYIKHQLKCRYYVRYVDDFILLAEHPKTLMVWREQINHFLSHELLLELKEQSNPYSVTRGIDFLGYIIHPYHKLVRRRVVGNLREKLHSFQRQIIKGKVKHGYFMTLNEELVEPLSATLSSYWGHFSHANSYHLRRSIIREFPWLTLLMELTTQSEKILRLCWQPRSGNITGYKSQVRYFQQHFPCAILQVQRGTECDVFMPSRRSLLTVDTNKYQVQRVVIVEVGYLKGGLKRRRLFQILIEPGVEICQN